MPKKYINPEILKSRFTNGYDDYFPLWKIEMFIDDTPAADVEEVKHGEWIQDTSPHRDLRFVCNKCKMALATLRVGVDSVSYTVGDNIANYCPNCGAKMDGKINNN